MKKLAMTVVVLIAAVSCTSDKEPVYKDATADIEDRVEDLIGRMTVEEKILQLNQYSLGLNTIEQNIGEQVGKIPDGIGSLIYFDDDAVARNAMQKRAMEESRLGIPILFGHDVIHGYRTIMPIPLAQACSWNPELTSLGCEVAAREAYSCGIDWTFSPMIDVARDPRWGRVMEGYGEDVYTNSVFCQAAVKGYQGEDISQENRIAACLKHFVGYAASEAGMDYVYTEISDQTLWDTYLPPFEAGIKAGAATLMSGFNNISATPITTNRFLLTEVVKNRWGLEGFVVSDWGSIKQLINLGMVETEKEAAELAFNAGNEMDMTDQVYSKYLKILIDEGKIKMNQIDDAVRRVLKVKFRLGLFEKPYVEEKPESERYLLPHSLEVAENLAAESMVLLKNENAVLPIENARTIALIGPMAANQKEHRGNWSARGRDEDVISILMGMEKEYKGKARIVHEAGCWFDGDDRSGFAKAVQTARTADVVVVCLGHRAGWSGENHSRSTLEIPQIQEDLLAALKATGKPIVVLTASGRPLEMREVDQHADAIIQIWHPGTCAGYAVAGILSGRHNPSGKLAMTFPYTAGQIPIYYNRRPKARNSGKHQGFYDDLTNDPMYPFGYGLSYSKFEYGPMTVSADEVTADGKLYAEVTVKNVSDKDGKETVHWYINDPYSHITRPVKELKFFEKKLIKAGESETFRFEIDPKRDLGFVNSKGEKYLDKGEYRIMVGDQTVSIKVI